jgi:hypothetical protein
VVDDAAAATAIGELRATIPLGRVNELAVVPGWADPAGVPA